LVWSGAAGGPDDHVGLGQQPHPGRETPFGQAGRVVRQIPAAKLDRLLAGIVKFEPVGMLAGIIHDGVVVGRHELIEPDRAGDGRGVQGVSATAAGEPVCLGAQIGNRLGWTPGHLHRAGRRLRKVKHINVRRVSRQVRGREAVNQQVPRCHALDAFAEMDFDLTQAGHGGAGRRNHTEQGRGVSVRRDGESGHAAGDRIGDVAHDVLDDDLELRPIVAVRRGGDGESGIGRAGDGARVFVPLVGGSGSAASRDTEGDGGQF